MVLHLTAWTYLQLLVPLILLGLWIVLNCECMNTAIKRNTRMRKILTTAAMVWCYCSVEKNYTKVTLWLLIYAFMTRPNYRPIILERRQNNPAYIWHHSCEVILCVVCVSSGYTDTQPIIGDSFVAQSIFRSSCSSGKIQKKNTHRKWDRRETSRKEKRGENGVKRNKKGDKTVGQ